MASAAASWAQFTTDYIDGLTLKDHYGLAATLLLAPGNHDATHAIGFYETMSPTTDATAMAEIYNLMLKPATLFTKDTYDYANDRIHYSLDVSGVHLAFVNIWPDSGARAWLETDLAGISSTAPVLLFTHDEPDVESKHFTNPNGAHDINATDKFENLLVDQFADGTSTSDPSTIEQRDFVTFVKAHGVDSPMKGQISKADETKVSFHMAVLDPTTKSLTVRECLWNTTPEAGTTVPLAWGESRTISLVTH